MTSVCLRSRLKNIFRHIQRATHTHTHISKCNRKSRNTNKQQSRCERDEQLPETAEYNWKSPATATPPTIEPYNATAIKITVVKSRFSEWTGHRGATKANAGQKILCSENASRVARMFGGIKSARQWNQAIRLWVALSDSRMVGPAKGKKRNKKIKRAI